MHTNKSSMGLFPTVVVQSKNNVHAKLALCAPKIKMQRSIIVVLNEQSFREEHWHCSLESKLGGFFRPIELSLHAPLNKKSLALGTYLSTIPYDRG